MEFSSEEDLYKRLLPALRSKVRELKLAGLIVKEEEIWELLRSTTWKDSHDLSINQVVSDIFGLTIEEVEGFIPSI